MKFNRILKIPAYAKNYFNRTIDSIKEDISFNKSLRKTQRELRSQIKPITPSPKYSLIKNKKLIKNLALFTVGIATIATITYDTLKQKPEIQTKYSPRNDTTYVVKLNDSTGYKYTVKDGLLSVKDTSINFDEAIIKTNVQNKKLEDKIKTSYDENKNTINFISLEEMKKIGREEGLVAIIKKVTGHEGKIYYKDLKQGSEIHSYALLAGIDLETDGNHLRYSNIEKLHQELYKGQTNFENEKLNYELKIPKKVVKKENIRNYEKIPLLTPITNPKLKTNETIENYKTKEKHSDYNKIEDLDFINIFSSNNNYEKNNKIDFENEMIKNNPVKKIKDEYINFEKELLGQKTNDEYINFEKELLGPMSKKENTTKKIKNNYTPKIRA